MKSLAPAKKIAVLRSCVSAVGMVFIMLATSNCSSTGSGFGDLVGHCSGSCSTATAASASVYLANQGFTITKASSYLGNCAAAPSNVCGNNSVVNPATGTFHFPQQTQVSGMCTTGGAAANQISMVVNYSSNGIMTPQLTDINGVPYSMYTTTCDNGRFNFIVTPPGVPAGNIALIYPYGPSDIPSLKSNLYNLTTQGLQLVVTLSTGPSLAALSTASQFATTFYVNY